MTTKEQTAVLQLKAACNTFYEQVTPNINYICNVVDFRDASKLSHIADRLDLFIKELNEF